MGLTNFPHGVSSFGMPVLGMGEETMTTGNVFFVDSGAANASDGNTGAAPTVPCATINGGIGKCTANNGDIVFVMPGHAESITATIALDVAGVWVRGLGWGDNRPTITATGSILAFTISAASCRVSNIICAPGGASVLAAFSITGAGVIVENCETRPHATSEFLGIISTAANDTVIRWNKFYSLSTGAGASTGIYLSSAARAQIYGNVVNGNFSVAALDNVGGSAAAVTDAVISHNVIRNYSATAGDLAIDMHDSATGLLAYNLFGGGLALASNFDPGNLYCLHNFLSDAVDVSAVAIPTTGAT